MKEVPNEDLQGVFVTGSFDRMVVKEKLNKEDGSYTKRHIVILIVRSEESTNLFNLRTKTPERYTHLKVGQSYTFKVFPRVFGGNLYFFDSI